MGPQMRPRQYLLILESGIVAGDGEDDPVSPPRILSGLSRWSLDHLVRLLRGRGFGQGRIEVGGEKGTRGLSFARGGEGLC